MLQQLRFRNIKAMLIKLTLFLIVLQLSASVQTDRQLSQDDDCQIADIVYAHGNIITMDKSLPSAKFVAIKDGKIIKVSDHDSNYGCYVGDHTQVVNLRSKTLLPGFIDGHSHFSLTSVVQSLGFSISPPPFGTVTSIAQMLQNAKDYIVNNNIPAGQKVYSEGYSDYQVIEHRHPTRFQLDWISTEHPILFKHFSAHVVVANTYAIQHLNISDSSTPPVGGIYDRFANGSLTGVFKEYAILPFVVNYAINFIQMTPQQIQKTVDTYFSVGITTAHDISFSMAEPTVFKRLGDSFPIDVNTYVWITSPDLTSFNNIIANYSTARVKHRGAKFLLDGSIQAYTALLSKPYWVPKANQYDNLDNYVYDESRSCTTENCGQNNFPYQGLLRSLFLQFHDRDLDVLAHCNGDGILDNFLDALSYTRANSQVTTSNSRFIAIHAQTAREDQLDSMVQLGANPSFFSPHIYYWGDQHYKYFLGPERSKRMNPAKSAVNRNLSYTLHNDSPVIMNGVFQGRNTFLGILDAAINRKTSGGLLLGEDQKITPYEALAGVTINSAWQSREQDRKGSITEGKIADLVILSDNPLKPNTDLFKDIQVLTTIKEGKVVFGSYPHEDP